jgi:hypothetical protein
MAGYRLKYRAATRLAGPPPLTSTILPSGCSSSVCSTVVAFGNGVVVMPEFPKLVSKLPLALKRATPNPPAAKVSGFAADQDAPVRLNSERSHAPGRRLRAKLEDRAVE